MFKKFWDRYWVIIVPGLFIIAIFFLARAIGDDVWSLALRDDYRAAQAAHDKEIAVRTIRLAAVEKEIKKAAAAFSDYVDSIKEKHKAEVEDIRIRSNAELKKVGATIAEVYAEKQLSDDTLAASKMDFALLAAAVVKREAEHMAEIGKLKTEYEGLISGWRTKFTIADRALSDCLSHKTARGWLAFGPYVGVSYVAGAVRLSYGVAATFPIFEFRGSIFKLFKRKIK